jgi:hypothetical protein
MALSCWHSQLNLVKHIPNNLSLCIGGTHFEMLAACNPTKANQITNRKNKKIVALQNNFMLSSNK